MRRWVRTCNATLFWLLITPSIFSQEAHTLRTTYFSADFLQIKESANYGLVFRGPSIRFGMNWMLSRNNDFIFYEYNLGLGAPLSKGIIGINFCLKPVETAYLWKLPWEKSTTGIGPSLKMEYNAQSYPDLQSGYNFWLTHYSLGLSANTFFTVNNSLIKIRLFTSLFGLTSRTEEYTDPYFFDIGFGEVIMDSHRNFKLTTVQEFNNTTIEIRFQRRNSSRFSLSYVMEYSAYSKYPEIRLLNQSIRFNLVPGTVK